MADGVSSGPTSEVASGIAIATLKSSIDAIAPEAGLEALAAALRDAAGAASREIAGELPPSASSDATTLAACCCLGADIVGVWAGDSRAYRIDGSEATRLTRDHSWAEGVVGRGLMTPEQAERDPRAHAITRWLGPQSEGEFEVDSFRLTLDPGEIILCCSDGLYGYFVAPLGSEVEMAETLGNCGDDLQGGLDRLVSRALQRGGHDDITGAGIRVVRS